MYELCIYNVHQQHACLRACVVPKKKKKKFEKIVLNLSPALHHHKTVGGVAR